MTDFPTNFASKPQPLTADFDESTNKAILALADKDLTVLLGLTPELVDQITKLAVEPHIREYCPRDCTDARFANRDSAEKWLGSGHAFFSLAKKDGDNWQIIGYGWSGPKKTVEVPGGQTTFAVRLAQAGLGQKLSVPFSQVVIGATIKLYDAKDLWLETWASNAGAVHVYHELGFKKVAEVTAQRPTVAGPAVTDTRLFMSLATS